jgi:hypothetical protein
VIVVVLAVALFGCDGGFPDSSGEVSLDGSSARSAPWSPLLDTLQHRTFDFFWETTRTETGLTPDRWPSEPFASVAAMGFALTAYPVGVERGYVSRSAAARRVDRTLEFLWNAPQHGRARGASGYRGFFYHFLEMQNGRRYESVELSSIDTALLMAGVLTCMEYFDRDVEEERRIRSLADSLYRRVQWDWMQPRPPLVGMGWTPEDGFLDYDYEGYNEAMILYILALGSPTHPIDASAWPAYVSTYEWAEFYGEEHVNFAPLFGHQYSHVWVDFREIEDPYMREKGLTYFENSERAVRAQRAYAIDNPNDWTGYGPRIWGFTASDGPADTTIATESGRSRTFHTYWARGAAAGDIRDDGTIAPTAAAGSLPFAPDVVVPTLEMMRKRYGDRLWSEYGFRDAFNPTFTFGDDAATTGDVHPERGWVDEEYLGIDQGPIVAMLENHRTGLIWRLMRANPYVRRGLRRAGFEGGWLEE